MIEQDTIRLLRECDAGVKMGIASLDDVMDRVQDQKLRRLHAAEQVRQGADAAPDALGREHGEVIGADKEKDQFTLGRLEAVIGELVDAHELPGGQMPPQLLFLFSIQS